MLISDLHEFASTVLLAVGALLAIVNPLGGAPIYLAMTSHLTPAERARLTKHVALYGFALLLASVLVGAYVLDFFGVSVPAVQVAGGFIVCAVAWSLLNSPSEPAVSERSQDGVASDWSRGAFYPLTMPLTVGPGSMSVAITLGANPPSGLRPLLTTALAHVLGVLITALAIYLCYRYAERILSRLGKTGISILIRLSAFMLFCIGVQIVWNGLHTLLATLIRPL